MPYIRQDRRVELDSDLNHLISTLHYLGKNDGDVNYVISRIIAGVYATVYSGFDNSYARLNSGIGVLEAVKQEFYRRVVVPYEDKKMAENGDIHES